VRRGATVVDVVGVVFMTMLTKARIPKRIFLWGWFLLCYSGIFEIP
jgi:hypothetical protein